MNAVSLSLFWIKGIKIRCSNITSSFFFLIIIFKYTRKRGFYCNKYERIYFSSHRAVADCTNLSLVRSM